MYVLLPLLNGWQFTMASKPVTYASSWPDVACSESTRSPLQLALAVAIAIGHKVSPVTISAFATAAMAMAVGDSSHGDQW